MKKDYSIPELELVVFQLKDAICYSPIMPSEPHIPVVSGSEDEDIEF